MENNAELYDKIANKTIDKMQRINKVLSYCEVESKFAKEGTEKLFEDIFNVSTDEIIVKEKYCKKYDLSKISAMFKTLDLPIKSTIERKIRSNSISSLASDDSTLDYMKELRNNLNDMREVLGSIQNSSIETLNEDSCILKATSKNNNFLELVFALQKLAREMTNIASTDNIPTDSLQLSLIDTTFIDHLKQLDKCLDEMQRLNRNKNPVTNLENKGNLVLEFTTIINSILETIEINSA